MRRFVIIVCVILAYLTLFASCKPRQKSVVTWLDSKWKSTSFIQEASEFLANENPQFFWKFIDAMSEVYKSGALADPTDREIYDVVLRIAKDMISGSKLKLLKFSLSLRAYSPAVEMNNQIAETLTGDLDCAAFVEIHSKTTCQVDEIDKLIESAEQSSKSFAFAADKKFPGYKSTAVLVVLYGDIGSPTFTKFYTVLKPKATKKEIDFIVRHYSKNRPAQPVRLSGYGVELAIKSTEYKAQDDTKIKANVTADGSVIEEEETEEDLSGFNFKKLKALHPDLKDNLQDLKMHILEGEELAPLKVWQLQDLSYQAAMKIVSAQPEEVLSTLQDISQNFPLLARSLTVHPVKSDFRNEIATNQEVLEELNVAPGESALFLNGMNIDLDTLDVYQLLDVIKKEEKLSAGFFNMGFRKEYLSLLMNLDLEEDSTSYALDFRLAYPEFLNNLETDKQYRDWGSSVRMMIQPYFPGMMRPIARNFFNLVFFVDPTTEAGQNLLKIGYSFYENEVPFRIGYSFIVNPDKTVDGTTDVGVALLNYYNFAKTEFEGKSHEALNQLIKFFDENRGKELTSKDVIDEFEKNYSDAGADLVFASDSDYDSGRQTGSQFLASSGLGKAPKVLLNGIPLDDTGLTADRFEETVVTEIMKITPKIQRLILDGKLTDKENVMNFIMDQPDVLPRLNTRILGGDDSGNSKPVYLDLTDVMEYKAKNVREFAALSTTERNAHMVQKMNHLSRNDELMTRPVTLWIVGDMETVEGRTLYYNAIKYLKHSHSGRIGLIHNPTDTTKEAKDTVVSRYIQAAINTIPNRQHARSFVTKLVKEENVEGLLKGTLKLKDLEVNGMDFKLFTKELGLMNDAFLEIDSFFARHALQMNPGQRGVVVNGQVIGPLNDEEAFEPEDFSVLEKFNMGKCAKAIADQIDKWEVEKTHGKSSDLVMRVSSLILQEPIKKKRQWVELTSQQYSVVTIPPKDVTSANFEILAIVDPLTRGAQKVAPLLQTLQNVVNSEIKVVMNCRSKLSEMPLKSFFRLVLDSELQFLPDGSLKPGPNARFGSLPQKQLFTMNLMPPESWLVESVDSIYDLDNIRMDMVESDVLAAFELEYLLIEGHCFDEVSGNPPRGLQFVLGHDSQSVSVDTTVMANLGYFQLKANPGAWNLRLRPGRSTDIYDITTHHNTDSPFNSPDVKVVLDSFTGKIVRIRVKKKPGMEEENLLTDSKEKQAEPASIWQSISEVVSSYTDTISGSGGSDESEINIFSLASGHLYERLMRIMFVSVMKTTKAPVKFWLLKNYLSPQFKKFLPYMSEHYGFDYELVQYKWPRWLHQQTEKQRLMWGYKILFLDVLFPLDVKKIIFIDADQVVRDDLLNLMRLDLEGAPYGYVPFCDSRTDMDGFRFWKSGYWASHLGARKYHISALYVVDLKKFRQIAAGDRLRGQYQGLSADPNSLSNLDQDLPNNMIHQVRIKSLPQEWLWCETWCDDKSKGKAKVIDLCNNPQTKEPKLQAGMRIIAEWKDYDDEIKTVLDNYENNVPALEGAYPKRERTVKKQEHEEHTEF